MSVCVKTPRLSSEAGPTEESHEESFALLYCICQSEVFNGEFPYCNLLIVGHTGREPVKLPFPVGCTTPVLGGLWQILLLTRPLKTAEEHCEQITTDENEAALLQGGFFLDILEVGSYRLMNYPCDNISYYSLGLLRKRLYFMKRIEDKFKRIVKYWSISYKQTSGRDRLAIAMFLMLLAYEWWLILVF